MHGPRGSPCLLISGAVKRLIAIVDYALRSVTSIPVRHGWRSRIVQCVKAREENDATGLKAALLTRECAARTWRGALTWWWWGTMLGAFAPLSSPAVLHYYSITARAFC